MRDRQVLQLNEDQYRSEKSMKSAGLFDRKKLQPTFEIVEEGNMVVVTLISFWHWKLVLMAAKFTIWRICIFDDTQNVTLKMLELIMNQESKC